MKVSAGALILYTYCLFLVVIDMYADITSAMEKISIDDMASKLESLTESERLRVRATSNNIILSDKFLCERVFGINYCNPDKGNGAIRADYAAYLILLKDRPGVRDLVR